jgi:hypothetical protein
MIDIIPVTSGVHRLIIDPDYQDLLSTVPYVPEPSAKSYCNMLLDTLGLDFYNLTIYDYERVLTRDRISGNFMGWHIDLEPNIDGIIMYYICDPNINESTGMRVGYRDLLTPHSTRFMDLSTGDCFLVRHDHERYEHCIEPRKTTINRRICVSIMFRGYHRLGLEL